MFSELWPTLEGSALAARIGESWWFPLLESIHVLTAMFVVGWILMVDLRLVGLAARRTPFSRMSEEMLPWIWAAFGVSVVAGIGMFMTRASWYIENPAFRIKLLLLMLAAINMLVFQFWIARSIASWDTARPVLSARIAGAASIVIWAGVTLAGRWTGHLS